MNVKFLNPFIDAACEVLKAECQCTVERGNLSMQKSSLTISLVGQVQGVVMYGLSVQTGLALVSRVMGQEFTEFDSLAQSGVAELGNVITGQATMKLSEAGFASNISPLQTNLGAIVAHLALRESPPGARDQNFVPVNVPAPAAG